MRRFVTHILAVIMALCLVIPVSPVTVAAQSPTHQPVLRTALADPPVITKVSAIADISVPFGTLQTDIDLPAQVAVTLDDASEGSVDVSWDSGTPAYSPEASCTYIFTGELDTAAYANPTDYHATVNVTVAPATPTPLDQPIAQVTSDTLVWGSISGADSYVVTITPGSVSPITLPASSLSLDLASLTLAHGAYSITLQALPPKDDQAHTESAASVPVDYLAYAGVAAVTDPAALEVAFGTAETEISLPAIIEASLTDGATELLTVTWDYPSASYDRNTPGTYTFLGDLALPFGISNPEGLRASIEVAVGLPPLATPVVIVSGNQITWNADELSSGYLVIFTLKSDAAKQVTETVTTAAIIPSDFVSHGTYLITVQSLSGDAGHLNSLPSDPATEYTVYADVTPVHELGPYTVTIGTAETSVLPSTVQVPLTDGTSSELAVLWDDGTPAYTPEKPGIYEFTGILGLSDGVGNTGGLNANATVIVQGPLTTPIATITDGQLTSTRVDYADSYEVTIKDSAGEWVATRAVTDPAIGLNLATLGLGKGTYSVTVIAKPVANDVTHVSSAASDPTIYNVYAMESVQTLEDITALWGTPQDKLDLPITVDITLDDGNHRYIEVVWDDGTPAYDPGILGSYDFTGTLHLPGDVINPGNLAAERTIEVVPAPLVTPADLSISINQLTWTTVEGAASYKVTAGDKCEEVTQSDAPGLDLTSLGLPCGEYSVTVMALPADGNHAPSSAHIGYVVRATVTEVPMAFATTWATLGTTLNKLPLPGAVTVTLSDGTTAQAGVAWLPDGYNSAVPDRYVLTGNLTTLPDGVSNAAGLQAAVRVYLNGNGSKEAPAIITSAAELDGIRDESPFWWDGGTYHPYHKLVEDIDLNDLAYKYGAAETAGAGWLPLPMGWYSQGGLDGDGHTIRNLYINRTGQEAGLFGYLEDYYEIKNLTIEGVDIRGGNNAGALAAYCSMGSVSISNCSVKGIGQISAAYFSGGLIGMLDYGQVSGCSASGTGPVSAQYAGGLVGYIEDADIVDSYAAVACNGSSVSGGLVGMNFYGTVTNSFAAGLVNGGPYGRGGAMGSAHYGSCSGVYYDSEVSGCTDTGKGVPLTTEQMKTVTSFVDWNLASTWGIDSGTYPYLQSSGRIDLAPPVLTLPLADLDINGGANVTFVIESDEPLAADQDFSTLLALTRTDADGEPVAFSLVLTDGGKRLEISPYRLEYNSNYCLSVQPLADVSGNKAQVATFSFTTRPGATIAPLVNVFEKLHPAELSFAVTWLDAESLSLRLGDGTLMEETNYAVNGGTLTINQEYLTSQPLGNLELVVQYNTGDTSNLTIQIGEARPRLVGAETDIGGKTVTLTFDKEMANPSGKQGQFTLKTPGSDRGFSSASLNSANQSQIILAVADVATRGYIPPGALTIKYVPGTVAAATNEFMDAVEGFAVENNVPFESGTGSAIDPYVITTAAQLDEVRSNLVANYRLASDIDLNVAPYNAGTGWEPIGTGSGYPRNAFKGTFDGDGFVISGLRINWSSGDYVGLFGVITSGSQLRNVQITKALVVGGYDVGALLGVNDGGAVSNSHVSGSISGSWAVGGLVGYSSGTIANCSAIVEVSGYSAVGGLAGSVDNWYWEVISVVNCYAQGRVSSLSSWSYEGIGGLIGQTRGGSVVNCYAAVKVESPTDSYKGGLLGSAYYAPSLSYYDSTVASGADNGKGTPKSTYEMMQESTFAGWDFDTVWDIQEGMSYPYLRGQKPIVWESGYPAVTDAAETQLKLNVQAGVGGTAYFVALPDAAPAPTATQIRAGQNAAGTLLADNLKGYISLAPGESGFAVIAGLTYPGSYDIYLVAEDADGRLQMIPTKIDAGTADVTPPVITLMDRATVRLPVGGTYTEYGATAADNVDGDVSTQIVVSGGVDANKAGIYEITYQVVDAAGNEGTASRTVIVYIPAPPASQVLNGAIRSLTWEMIKGLNAGLDSITRNLDLPSQISGGDIRITWSTDNPAISPTGQVTRPAWGQGDAIVTLTATLKHTYLTNPEVVTFTVVVPQLDPTPQQLAELDLDEAAGLLTLDSLQGVDANTGDVAGNLTLPAQIGNGVTITWSAGQATITPGGSVVPNDPNFEGTPVVLTATLTKPGAEPRTVTFTLNIGGAAEPEPEPEVMVNTIIGSGGYTANGEQVPFDAQTCYISQQGISVMALRMFAALGASFTYDWYPTGGEIAMTYGSRTVHLREGSNQMTISDEQGTRTVTLRTSVVNRDGRAYIPTRDVSEYLGFTVNWNAADDSITITRN